MFAELRTNKQGAAPGGELYRGEVRTHFLSICLSVRRIQTALHQYGAALISLVISYRESINNYTNSLVCTISLHDAKHQYCIPQHCIIFVNRAKHSQAGFPIKRFVYGSAIHTAPTFFHFNKYNILTISGLRETLPFIKIGLKNISQYLYSIIRPFHILY